MKLFESFVYTLLFCLLTNTKLYERCILFDCPYVSPENLHVCWLKKKKMFYSIYFLRAFAPICLLYRAKLHEG